MLAGIKSQSSQLLHLCPVQSEPKPRTLGCTPTDQPERFIPLPDEIFHSHL